MPRPAEKRHRRFLGLELGGWTQMVVTALLAGVVFITGWFVYARDTIRESASVDDVAEVRAAAEEELRDAIERERAADATYRKGVEDRIRAVENAMIQTRTDIGYIRSGIDEIKSQRRRR